ncbi:cache domain-containing protein [Inquilinus sp. CAU 1745]|uniref:methyl-accepting chemotaxis protein n=1 Tax=Inquilinus sp. CAU 1745 TaxID=3140369 RepID=UPI00325B4A4A
MFLNRLKIGVKLWLLVGLSIAAMAAAAGAALFLMHGQMMNDRMERVRAITETAHGIATGLQEQVEAGTLDREQATARLREVFSGMRYDDGEYMFAVTLDGDMVAHVNPDNIGKNFWDFTDPEGNFLFRELTAVVEESGEGSHAYLWPRAGEEEPVEKISYAKGVEGWGIYVGTGIYLDDVSAAFWRQAAILGIMILALGALVGGAAVVISRNVAGPLRTLNAQMRDIAGGDLKVTVSGIKREDEVGVMARAVEVFRAGMLDNRRMAEEQETMKRQAEKERRDAMLALASSFESSIGGIVDGVSSTSTELHGSAESMAAIAEQTTAQAGQVARAGQDASRNVQTVSAATEELTASFAEIVRRVTDASSVAREASENARHTNDRVIGLTATAESIGAVVQLIQDIASQTNLLALNATIEAARAGEMGKGFAVVASEVKNLANQTAKATEEISAKIQGMQAETTETAKAIGGVVETITRIDEISAAIAAAAEEQQAATQEISRNVLEAATSTEEVSSNIDGVDRAARETGGASAEVLSASRTLSDQAERLRGEVASFLSNVRAA